jgi:hypothetical protein
MMTGNIIWCSRCGAHTRKRRQLILKQCRGIAKFAAQRRMIDCFADGRDIDGNWIGTFRQLRYSDALGWICMAEHKAIF